MGAGEVWVGVQHANARVRNSTKTRVQKENMHLSVVLGFTRTRDRRRWQHRLDRLEEGLRNPPPQASHAKALSSKGGWVDNGQSKAKQPCAKF